MTISTYTNYPTLQWIHAAGSKPFRLHSNCSSTMLAIFLWVYFILPPPCLHRFLPTLPATPPTTPYLLLLILILPTHDPSTALLISSLRCVLPLGFGSLTLFSAFISASARFFWWETSLASSFFRFLNSFSSFLNLLLSFFLFPTCFFLLFLSYF